MSTDPILEELWAARAKLWEQADRDPDRFFDQLKERERASGRKVYATVKEALADYRDIRPGKILEAAENARD